MPIAELKRTPGATAPVAIRGTAGQDAAITAANRGWRRHRWIYIAMSAALLVILVFTWLVRGWAASSHVAAADRLHIVPVSKERFVRDVAAQGTIIAAISPTLFATATGTVSYVVHAGDTVGQGQTLATLDSPALNNEYQRERTTLESLNAALARQEIEIRRQILTGRQQSDLAQVAIHAAEREFKRNASAWQERVISERDYRRASDELESAKLNYEHALQAAALERDRLSLELRTRRLERDRQALVVAGLEQRVAELTLRSPIAGMVANLAQTEKARVAESAPLLTIVDLTAFAVEFQVADTYAADIKAGMAADITLNGRIEPGVVTGISPEVRQSEVTGRVKFAREQPPGLRQNQRAAVRVVLDERDAVLQFEHGSFIDETTRSVYVVRGDRAVRVPVKLGATSVSGIEIVRGLTAGDRVIISDMRDFKGAPQVVIAD